MELKDYQSKTLTALRQFLDRVKVWKERCDANPEYGLDPAERAWSEIKALPYKKRVNGLGESVPNACIKIPTGGGKTLIAIHAIGEFTSALRGLPRGLIVWVVPTSQIYDQTLERLRDRSHPYRQHLNNLCNDKVRIITKLDFFTPSELSANLVVLLLMLPSANRSNGEVLRFNRDSSFFADFVPDDANPLDHAALLEQHPNLDCFADELLGFKQIKSSLSNAIRLSSPIVIIDEGQKAYTTLAQQTIYNLNPSIIMELSATPPQESNVLVEVLGQELLKEQMIKLDLHLINDEELDWQETLRASVVLRGDLEEEAHKYQEHGGRYVRPIALIQVERTGNAQRGQGFIHAEDVREFLITQMGIPPNQIAVKSSELNELAQYDTGDQLTTDTCPIRYIITKQALQEGWDCSFAYILIVLANPSSRTALTQLVGRILRQPYASKTGITLLDESYVLTYRRNGVKLLREIAAGFKAEGLTDLAERISQHKGPAKLTSTSSVKAELRSELTLRFPLFLRMLPDASWKFLSYAEDIEVQIPWRHFHCESLANLTLSDRKTTYVEVLVGLTESTIADGNLIAKPPTSIDDLISDICAALTEVVPNPWEAYRITRFTLEALISKYSVERVIANVKFISEEIQKATLSFRDSQAELIFRNSLDSGEIVFDILEQRGFKYPENLHFPAKAARLTRDDNTQIEKSLHQYYLDADFNSLEKPVVMFLEHQHRLLYWFRNHARTDYGLQGWKRHKIYPDFIFAIAGAEADGRPEMCVLETKGLQLTGNPDSIYKLQLLKICEERWAAKLANLDDLVRTALERDIRFAMLDSVEWQRELVKLF